MTNGDKIRSIRETTEAIMEQIDNAAMEAHVNDAVNYLDWYFHQDEGMADKDAVASWEKVKAMIPVWHDVKTDPPKEDGDYFALHDEDVVEIWECCDGEFGYEKADDWISSKDCGIDITHWMNIPTPPKDGEQG